FRYWFSRTCRTLLNVTPGVHYSFGEIRSIGGQVLQSSLLSCIDLGLLIVAVLFPRITVSFNVNNSIPPNVDEPPEGQKDNEVEPELTSTPNFVVEVSKDDTKQTLVLDCHYPEDEISHTGEGESDMFSIQEVSFQPGGDSDWQENNYTLNTDSLDWALYDHLMDFLADRGVDNTFADELVNLSTALEHKEYIRFLEDLKHFVKCQ
ncbi:PREDICTED: complement component 1 Q subcomponent-binding protein, mitochondrial, partial [Thamnophis sirtalis]|uniref:Complement component 1 Q subcomponent-binding protein, mitochondrial n=1 Tax=Thamnophis sirtalis TaxID=35019 RepID=A0A6I9X2K3_9SAUR